MQHKKKNKIITVLQNLMPDMVIRSASEESNGEKVLKKKYYSKNNKRKKQQPFSGLSTFKFSDYDCIGFDLDNTICRYKVGDIMRLEYELIASYLVNKYGYDSILLLPLDEDIDFLQKGLIMDIKRGNFLKCSDDGKILKATHGTNPMFMSEIEEVYGKDRTWQPVIEFKKSFYDKGSTEIRSFNNYFDLPAAVACARAIDAEDHEDPEGPKDEYDIWPDVHVAMCSLYRREYFRSDQGGFFPEMKANPGKYIYEASDRLKGWLKNINDHTFTFLISGSSIDYASHIAKFVLGQNWRDYFDMLICTAKKPGFFTSDKPFLNIDGIDDGDPVLKDKLEIDGNYANGNWNDLLSLVKRETHVENPHCLYVGDHLCQDVMVPSQQGIDTVAIVEELAAEGMIGDGLEHEFGPELMSMYWGSFFETDSNKNLMGIDRINTLFASVPVQHSRISLPFLDVASRFPIKHEYQAFTEETSGFNPGDPVILHF